MSIKQRAATAITAMVIGAWFTRCDAADFSTTVNVATPTQTLVPAAIELSPMEIGRAKRWGMSSSDWQRYESLMTGIRGSVSPANLSPIEVLGIHARSDAERRQYAELWARLMHDDVERVLAFQRAYDEATRRLYGNEPLISSTETPGQTSAAFGKTDRLLLFVSSYCEDCDAAVKDTLRQQPRVAGIDIYLVGLKLESPAAVQAWAASHGISVALVKNGEVTLNFESGALARLGQSMATLPLVMRRRQDEVTVIDLAALR